MKDIIKKWVLRYVKFNVVGVTVWAINTVIYFFLFTYFGMYTWFLVAINGGIIEFTLITYMNKTKKGTMFEGCKGDSLIQTGEGK